MRTEELNFHLPPELIAQAPPVQRSASRLLHYRRDGRHIQHRRFADLPSILRPGDLLVFNDARVLPARFMLRKHSGGLIEGLFLNQPAPARWNVLLKNPGSVGDRPFTFVAEPSITAKIVRSGAAGEHAIELCPPQPATELLARIGRMPLPPYIKRDKQRDVRDDEDRVRYQTVYARSPGAVAAPTAGLHFTPRLLDALDQHGVGRCFVTLHVGIGTFRPVSADTLEQHDMHAESYTLDAAAADTLNAAKAQGRRIIAVGTTAARVLESQPAHGGAGGPFTVRTDETRLFIYPPYEWKHVEAIITNFHLPRSTLIAMVAALVSLDEQRRIYRTAIEEKYRFFSYGDAMLIE
jgi:S-adenosylmethionine:tRNA ribosyltransferase-isomerase